MYFWVLGFNESGVKSLAGPFRSRDDADKDTKNFAEKKIYQMDSPDRQAAMTALANKPARSTAGMEKEKNTRRDSFRGNDEVKDTDDTDDSGLSDDGISEEFSGDISLDL